jgi:hypothetical protein
VDWRRECPAEAGLYDERFVVAVRKVSEPSSPTASSVLPLHRTVAKFRLPFKCELWEYLGSQREPPVPSQT